MLTHPLKQFYVAGIYVGNPIRKLGTMSLVMFLHILWTYASVVPILWNGLLNSVLHTIIESVLCLILIIHPPFYTVEMNSIILSAFFCSLWGGIMACFFKPMSKWSLASPSPVLTNCVYHFLIYGGAVAIWPLTLKFFPKFFRRNWLVKIEYQKVEHSPKSTSTLRKLLPQKEVIGYTMKLGQTTYVKRYNGFPYPPTLTTQPLSAPSFPVHQTPILLTPTTRQETTSQHIPSTLPSILPVSPPLLSGPSINPPPSQVQSLYSIHTVMPLTVTSARPKQTVESVVALTEDNMKDAINHIVKSIKHPRQVQELFAFLQVEAIAKDQFTLRMIDQTFRKLIAKPRFGMSTKVRMTYALFLAHHLNSQYRMAAQIQKLCDFFPNLTERWICYIKTKEMEKKVPLVSEQAKPTNLQKLREVKLQNPKIKLHASHLLVTDEDALSALTSFSNTSEDNSTSSKTYLLKFQLDQAQKLVKIAQGHLAMMWMHLGRRNVDCDKVQEHAIQTLEAEKEATQIYLQQLKEHPSNSNVLRQFALLLRDLTNDEETSSILLQEADKIEDGTASFSVTDWNEDAIENDFTDDEASHHTNPSSSIHTTEKEPSLNDMSGSNQIEVLIKNFPNTNTVHTKTSILIYVFVISALIAVLAITIVSFSVSHADFAAYENRIDHPKIDLCLAHRTVSIPEMSRLIILSGYRRSYFNMLIGFDVLRLKPTEFGLADPQNQTLRFETTKYTTVILNNTEFIHDVSELDEVISRCVQFLTNMGTRFLYGSVSDALTGDEFYDNLNSKGTRGRFAQIDSINTRQDSCFLENRTKCQEEGRLGSYTGEFSGLLEVISKVLMGSVKLTFDDSFSTKYEDQDMTFLINLTRQDIQGSLRQIGFLLQAEQGSLTNIFQTALVIMIVAVSLTELVLALIFFIPLPSRLNKIEVLAGQLSRLAKSTEKKSLEWSEELQTNVMRLDTLKEMLHSNLVEMLDLVEQKRRPEEIDQVMDQLILLTIAIFDDEEVLMDTYSYPLAVKHDHLKQHATLFKKLLDFVNSHSRKRPSLDATRQFCSTWIQPHITTDDFNLASFLQQVAPQSALNSVPDVNSASVPRSIIQFYRRASIGMEERTMFETVMARLGLNNDDSTSRMSSQLWL
ncbi:hypothetical protein BLNAU_19957 [Blattamonas nauphoetae]|uniref:TmcB/TmcC TPR repeats domain-containing protein n=1 Tax=Blattamonas nauphoetae TaxID=2049346 RepID=A0ABQ9X0K6_9EUKA|nr:hypothetical protein BLNAU_19957 [Blattamonas nauphoetae]